MKIKLSKSQWEGIGKKAGWIKMAMNMGKMNIETERLKTVAPTKFVSAYCEFWAGAMDAFKNHVPKNHFQDDKISIEAVEAFKRCFHEGYTPKVSIYE